jgi:hypothetical protein
VIKIRKSKRQGKRTLEFNRPITRAIILKQARRIFSEDSIRESSLYVDQQHGLLSIKNSWMREISWVLMKCGLRVELVRGGNLLKKK